MIKFFTASWCSACQTLKNNLQPEDLENVIMVDADSQQAEVIDAGVRSIPAIIKYDAEGIELDRTYGSMSRTQFLKFVE